MHRGVNKWCHVLSVTPIVTAESGMISEHQYRSLQSFAVWYVVAVQTLTNDQRRSLQAT